MATMAHAAKVLQRSKPPSILTPPFDSPSILPFDSPFDSPMAPAPSSAIYSQSLMHWHLGQLGGVPSQSQYADSPFRGSQRLEQLLMLFMFAPILLHVTLHSFTHRPPVCQTEASIRFGSRLLTIWLVGTLAPWATGTSCLEPITEIALYARTETPIMERASLKPLVAIISFPFFSLLPTGVRTVRTSPS
jgi:hypothetical protein